MLNVSLGGNIQRLMRAVINQWCNLRKASLKGRVDVLKTSKVMPFRTSQCSHSIPNCQKFSFDTKLSAISEMLPSLESWKGKQGQRAYQSDDTLCHMRKATLIMEKRLKPLSIGKPKSWTRASWICNIVCCSLSWEQAMTLVGMAA